MAGTFKNQDVVLLVVAAANGTGLTPVQLMKSVFLVGKSGHSDLPPNFYPFFAYNYGPFHPSVYSDVETLVDQGLVCGVQETGRSWSKYVVTPTGLEYAEKVKQQIADEFVKYIGDVVSWVRSLTFNELLRAIYAKYPEMRENSVFQEV